MSDHTKSRSAMATPRGSDSAPASEGCSKCCASQLTDATTADGGLQRVAQDSMPPATSSLEGMAPRLNMSPASCQTSASARVNDGHSETTAASVQGSNSATPTSLQGEVACEEGSTPNVNAYTLKLGKLSTSGLHVDHWTESNDSFHPAHESATALTHAIPAAVPDSRQTEGALRSSEKNGMSSPAGVPSCPIGHAVAQSNQQASAATEPVVTISRLQLNKVTGTREPDDDVDSGRAQISHRLELQLPLHSCRSYPLHRLVSTLSLINLSSIITHTRFPPPQPTSSS